MKNLQTRSFSIFIQANSEKIWHVLWDPKKYEDWARVFGAGGHYKGELKQGNTIQFLGDGGGGMSSHIEKLVENEQIVFAHQNEIRNGVEMESNWQGAKEIYYLKKESGTGTELQVIMDLTPDMEDFFKETFPKALALIKQLAEQN